MKLFTTTLILLLSVGSFSQTLDVVGSWENSLVMTGNDKKEELVDSLRFSSILSLNSDSTFTLVTSGYEAVMGKFSMGSNYIVFFKLTGFEEYQRFWDIRWEQGTNDPFADTPGVIDMMLPTKALVQNKKKRKPFTSQVYVVYTKLE